VEVGASVTVVVPPWSWGDASDVRIETPGVLSEQCSVLLPNRGREEILTALSPGHSGLFATVTPPSDLMMPAWLGTVEVSAAS
jgi:hypothetical protein